MRRSAINLSLILVFGLGLLVATSAAADFQKSYSIPAGGQIKVRNISGDITVTGYDGQTIMVSATKEGRDRDDVTIEDRSSGDTVDLSVEYPHRGNVSASVNFDIRVPRAVEYNFGRLVSVSGNVQVSDVMGNLQVESVSGDVDVNGVSGVVSASAVSGNVNVDLKQAGSGNMKFSSVSGDVAVRAPANLDADVEMSTISGSLNTNFDLEIHEPRYGPGRSARGRLGSGTHSLRITTVSGRVSLTRA
jgi:DUF4097 and DUF4098 domain-containing protein YvlB